MVQKRKHETLARASGTSRRASGWVRSRGFFEHPMGGFAFPIVPHVEAIEVLVCRNSFPAGG